MASKSTLKTTYNQVVGAIIFLFITSGLATFYTKGKFIPRFGLIVFVIILFLTIFALHLHGKIKNNDKQ